MSVIVNEMRLTACTHDKAGYARTDLKSLAFEICATFTYATKTEAEAHTLQTGTRFEVIA
tara:strand:+ start:1423 stop:1602 length:180 start_codon:yes stop_codon:yes gene_type:complete